MQKYSGNSTQSTRILHWQRGVLILYAGLFGLILPFICWGAYADPAHAHAHAHFIFVQPPVQKTKLSSSDNARPKTTRTPSHSVRHSVRHHALPGSHPADATSGPIDIFPLRDHTQDADLSGAAKPSVLVIASIMLVLLFAWTLLRIILPAIRMRRTRYQPSRSHLIRVPTPPPRAIAC